MKKFPLLLLACDAAVFNVAVWLWDDTAIHRATVVFWAAAVFNALVIIIGPLGLFRWLEKRDII